MPNLDLIIQIGSMLLAAGVIYGAIRSDIKNIHKELADNKQNSDKAHERIDDILRDGILSVRKANR